MWKNSSTAGNDTSFTKVYVVSTNIPRAVNEPRAHKEYLRYARAHGKTKLPT